MLDPSLQELSQKFGVRSRNNCLARVCHMQLYADVKEAALGRKAITGISPLVQNAMRPAHKVHTW